MKKVYIGILFLLLSMQPIVAVAEGFVVFADALYWQASEQSVSTWATFIRETNSNTIDIDATNVDFDYKLGFRGGVTYEAHNFWETDVFWTNYYSTTSSNFQVGRQIVLPEFFSGFISEDIFFGAKLDWRLIMNMFDIAFAHKFKPARSFTVRPAFGIKGGTIYQDMDAVWRAAVYNSREYVEHDFTGIGPSFAIDTRWNMYKNFSFIGDFYTAFMWGHWKITDTYSRPNALGGLITATTITTNMTNTQLGTAMFGYRLGLEWTYSGRSNVTLQIGYEMQIWVNQLRMPTFQQLPVHGDLTLQGGTCRIRVDL
jgi:hypothetical protein